MNINLLTGADELIRRLIIVDLLIVRISLFRDFLFYEKIPLMRKFRFYEKWIMLYLYV